LWIKHILRFIFFYDFKQAQPDLWLSDFVIVVNYFINSFIVLWEESSFIKWLFEVTRKNLSREAHICFSFQGAHSIRWGLKIPWKLYVLLFQLSLVTRLFEVKNTLNWQLLRMASEILQTKHCKRTYFD